MLELQAVMILFILRVLPSIEVFSFVSLLNWLNACLAHFLASTHLCCFFLTPAISGNCCIILQGLPSMPVFLPLSPGPLLPHNLLSDSSWKNVNKRTHANILKLIELAI